MHPTLRQALIRRFTPLALLAIAPFSAAQTDAPPPTFDPETGRSTLNYPPSPSADFLHMDLNLSIPDMNTRVITARQHLRFTPVGSPLDTLTLDAKLLEIERVSAEGEPVAFEHDGQTLMVTFAEPIQPAETAEVLITYRIVDPPNGLYWTTESDAFPDRAAQIHSQGEPEMNSYWFPIHDFPNDRLTTNLSVLVPYGYTVSSNGRLDARFPSPGVSPEGTPRFEYFNFVQDKPHVPYLVTLIVGKFDIVDVGTEEIPMPVYVPPGRGEDVAGTYGRTADMTAFFAELFDEPYPWDRYAQLVVWNFAWGGMENTAATTMYDGCLIPADDLDDHDEEGLISHELAHQWFGDLVTCNSWEHIWLNEGFATYCEALWYEHDRGEDDYLAEIQLNFDDVIANDRGTAPADPAMISKLFEHPEDIFLKDANPYPKGASVLHMLRRRLGDEVFFEACKTWLDEQQFQSAETDQLRRTFERAGGQNLERFFDQWCARPGIPRLEITVRRENPSQAPDGELTVLRVEQTQAIDANNPAFEFDLPIYQAGEDNTPFLHSPSVLRITRRVEEFELFDVVFNFPPSFIAVDPHLSVLAEIHVEQSPDTWVRQLKDGPTLPSRIQAARHLAELDHGRIHLRDTAADPAKHHALRTACIKALAAHGDTPALLGLAGEDLDSWRVRAAIATALADTADPDPASLGWLRDRIESDSSTRVRAAAIRALGILASVDDLPIIELATRLDSHKDQLRQAALDALVSLDEPRGLEIAISLTRDGLNQRTRAAALDAVAQLSVHDPNAAFDTIRPFLDSRIVRIADAAGEALVELRDERAIYLLEEMAQTARDPDDRFKANRWLARLRRDLGEG